MLAECLPNFGDDGIAVVRPAGTVENEFSVVLKVAEVGLIWASAIFMGTSEAVPKLSAENHTYPVLMVRFLPFQKRESYSVRVL